MSRGFFVTLFAVAGVLAIVFLLPNTYDQAPTMKTGTVQFENGVTVAVEVVDTAELQRQGLSGHKELTDDQGMLFVFDDLIARTFWMKDMTFAIDIIWIYDGRVVGIEKSMQPPAASDGTIYVASSPEPVDHVLEVAAGWSDRHGVQVGQGVDVID
ncbi:MAG: DUF192 domain-containing protein [Patescibacteria group bacterium]